MKRKPSPDGKSRNNIEPLDPGPLSEMTELMDVNDESSRKRPPKQCLFLLVIFLLVVLVLILFVILLNGILTKTPRCGGTSNSHITPAREIGIFDSLSKSELEKVRDYMLKYSGLPLVEITKSTPTNAYIFLIDLHVPYKKDAIKYLDKKGAKPKRLAKVYVTRGDLKPAILEEYLVSLSESKHELYKNPSYTKDPLPHHTRPYDPVESKLTHELYRIALKKVSRILKESYGAKYEDCDKEKEPCLILIEVAPRGRASGERQTWAFVLRDVSGYYLHPVGFQILVDHPGTDVNKWKVIKYYYNNKLFDSAEDLIEAYDNGGVGKMKIPFPENSEKDLYSSFIYRGEPSGEPLRPPVLVYPDGPRYKITGNHVSYMNWQFDFRMDPSTGVRLFDVRFQGERVVYEFANVDALVFYSGHNPMQGIVNFYDASWLLGVYSFELAKGIDCPEVATFFNYPFLYNTHDVRMNRNSMCLFEHDNGLPLGRHYSADFVTGKGYRRYGGMKDNVLVLRYIPVIWNYDYVIDLMFHQDGVLEARVATTGYLQSTLYSSLENKFGLKIQDFVQGPLHHHVLNFKADIDVAGTKNRFKTLDIKLGNESYPWSDEPQRSIQKYIETTQYKTEKSAALKYNFEEPKYYIVYNNDSQNNLGYNRGVRVKLSGMSKLLVPVDGSANNPANGAAVCQYQVAVTRQKDSETSSTSLYSQNDPYQPVIDFNTFINDDESIVDEDLVVWATLGVHHIPSVEDVPVTSTSSNRASIFLVPYNFHNVNPIVNSRDIVSFKPSMDFAETFVERNGVEEGVNCVPSSGEFTFNGTEFLP